MDGVSNTRFVPHLSGQRIDYLASQLLAFKDNTRGNRPMHAVVMSLSEGLIKYVAAYFWAQGQVPRGPVGTSSEETSSDSAPTLAPKLAEVVKQCDDCHEPNEKNRDVIRSYPILAGQRQEYLANEMRDFQNKHNRGNPMMTSMTELLGTADIAELAGYYANRDSSERLGRH